MMTTPHTPGSARKEKMLISFKRERDPMERVLEILFGLIHTLAIFGRALC